MSSDGDRNRAAAIIGAEVVAVLKRVCCGGISSPDAFVHVVQKVGASASVRVVAVILTTQPPGWHHEYCRYACGGGPVVVWMRVFWRL